MAEHVPGANGRSDGHVPSEPEAGLSSPTQKMWLSDMSIRQPVFIAMMVFAVVLVGFISYSRLAVNLMPDISLQTVTISTSYSGASPREVERSITKPIEDAVASISGAKAVRSTSAEGSSAVTVEFETGTDIKTALEDVRNRVGMIRNGLPADATDPLINKTDTSAMPVVAFAVADSSGNRSPEELRALADDQLKQQIERIEGVGSVIVFGGRVREIHVESSLEQLQSYGITPQQLSQAIRAENLDLPGGRITEGPTEELLVRTAGKITSLEQLGDVPVSTPKGIVAHLKDLATITRSTGEVRSYSRLDGSDSVMVIVQKQSGANTVRVSEAVQAGLRNLQKQYPSLRFGIIFDQSTFTRDSINDVQLSLILGGILAALVVFLFFRDVRNTLVTVAGLPVVLLGTFIALNALGISLNMISMMALSLSVGLLIDDAIVVRENIFRHMEMGHEPRAAAGAGSAEIAMAVLAVTSTIVAVFLPIAFVNGMVGQFLRDFGVTITVAVVISLIEAFTLAPMLSALFFHKIDPETDRKRKASAFFRFFDALNVSYGKLLGWSLSHRWLVVAAGILCLASSLALVPLMNQSFQATSDQGEFAVLMELKSGTSLQEADRIARKAEQIVREEPSVATMFSSVGSSGGAVNSASIGAKLKSRGHTVEIVDGLRSKLSAALPGVKITYNTETAAAGAFGSAASAMTSQPILYKIQGEDFDKLDQVSREMVATLQKVPGLVDADRSARDGGPQRVIVLDRARATDLGISTSSLATTVRTMVNGDKAGTFQDADKDIDIVVRLSGEERENTESILQLPISTNRGTQLPLSAVASLLPSTEPAKIDRENRQRQVIVSAGVSGSDAGPAMTAAQAAVASMKLPDGVTLVAGGDTQQTNEAFAALFMALGLSIAFMYMILASQFGSFIHPFTIMLALPFAVVGAMVALVVARFSLDAMSMIGMILLMGLVSKNSILLVEFTNQMRQRGMSTREAILHAGPVRLRPILMTTLSMICGMLPVAVGFGAGAEMRQPMGVSVIGGVITSTVLTLVVVPVAYSLIDDLGNWIVRRFRRGKKTQNLRAESQLAEAFVQGEN
jgi:hydrophobic/amphiphilic exporter-1 (mainly G- bacteria), HAE1 family